MDLSQSNKQWFLLERIDILKWKFREFDDEILSQFRKQYR